MPFESLKPYANGRASTARNAGPLLAHRSKNDQTEEPSRRFLFSVAPKQSVLLLHAAGEKYTLEEAQEIPEPKSDGELLIRVLAIGLNPVDWKGADYDFGQPEYPWINGKDFAGVVVRGSGNSSSRIQEGNIVLGTTTDYRDIRKAAFQEYLVANDYNVSRIPGNGIRISEGATIGVAFTAAVISLGVCFGLDFSKLYNVPPGPNLLSHARAPKYDGIPEDIRDEVFNGISDGDRPKSGEWLVVWGAGVAGQFIAQLAKFAGLKVACVDDLTQSGEKLAELGLDFMIDYKGDSDRIVEILRAVTGGKLRFGVDTVGKKTAESLQKVLKQSESGPKAHLAGFSGLPDDVGKGVVHHKALPIKLFHEVPNFGESICKWLEDLLLAKLLSLPEVENVQGGLSGVNDALDRLRRGEVLGKRLVVPVKDESNLDFVN